MMSSKVEVLCPNGHRVNVKTTPNTTLVQILEEACNKKGFHPASEYDLKHGSSKKPLDLTLTVRFAGLPNHAKLEMVKAAKSRGLSNVTVALQLDTGERIQREWNPAVSLWEILEHGCTETGKQLTLACDGSQPVCVYMREEVTGEYALKQTSLHDLGLISGRAILRLIHKVVEDTALQEIKAKLDREKARQANMLAKSQSSQRTEMVQPAPSITVELETAAKPLEPEAMEISTATHKNTANEVNTNANEVNISTNCDSSVPMDADHESMDMEEKSTCAIETKMEAESIQQTSGPTPSPSHQEPSLPSSSLHSSDISIPGLQIFRPGEAMQGLSEEQEQIARQMAEAIMPGIFPQRSGAEVERLRREREKRLLQQQARTNQRMYYQPLPQPNFAEFKFPEETKGKDLYNNELSEYEAEEFKSCDREAVLYKPDDINSSSVVPVDPGEDFFEITEADLKKMMSDLQRQVVEQSEQPLMTQAMRKAQLESRLSKYSHAFIRVTFPDKLVLQGTFKPRETVYSLYKFVKEHLEDKSISFYLYTSPPKHILTNKTMTLMEASLVPMTVVYFGSDTKRDHYLSTAVLKEISSTMVATKIVASHMRASEERPGTSLTSHGTKRATTTSPGNSTSVPQEGGSKKVPKWFKMGK